MYVHHWWSDPIPSRLIAVHNILYYIYTSIRVHAACVCVKTCGIQQVTNSNAGRVIVVPTVTRYGLYSSEFEPREVEISRTRSGRPRGPPSLLHSTNRVSSQGVNRSGRGVDHPPPSRAGVKENFLVYFAGIVGSNPADGMSVCCWVLCVVR